MQKLLDIRLSNIGDLGLSLLTGRDLRDAWTTSLAEVKNETLRLTPRAWGPKRYRKDFSIYFSTIILHLNFRYETLRNMKKEKVKTKELGLLAGLIFGKYFFGTEDLHFGFWTDDLEVDKNNFAKAQEKYSNFIISHIPASTKTILDVGCGAGILASKLLNRGFSVDCVSPSPMLTERVQELLGDRTTIFKCLFEEMESDRRYDTLIFGESFQYIEVSTALRQSLKFLNQGGHLLICDCFQTDARGKGPIGGGHRLSKFYEAISELPFEPIQDIDITKQTMPNIELFNEMLHSVGLPIKKIIFYYFDNNRPLVSRFLQWKYKKNLEKIDRTYFGNEMNAVNYQKYNSYRLLLYRKEGY